MSSSSSQPTPRYRQATATDIPTRLKAADIASLSRTPGGNNLIYGSTPGGTKIVYSRDQLLSLASSPLSHTPPKGLNNFPPEMSRSFKATSGLSSPSFIPSRGNGDVPPLSAGKADNGKPAVDAKTQHDKGHADEEQFEMDV